MCVLQEMPRDDMAVVLVAILNNKDSTWRDKLAEYLPWLSVTSDWDEFKKLPFPKLLLVHFEEVHTIITKIKRAARWITFAIIDEAHRLKARGSRQSRACGRLSIIRKRLILTGTPIEKQPKDLWGQFRFVLPDLFGSWKDFEEEYLDFKKIDMEGVMPGTARWQIKIMQQGMLRSRATFREDKLPQLIEAIKPYALRLTKEDVGILPPEVIKVVVPITGEQRRLYDRMKRHSVIHLGDGQRCMAPLTVTNIVKRRQIASGFVIDDDGECHRLGDAKLEALLQLVASLPKPVVVFTVFDPEHDYIVRALEEEGYQIASVRGSVKKKFRADIWRDFQRVRYDAIVCQVRTGGVGVDLWKADSAIAHSLGYSSIDFDQAKSRMDSKDKTEPSKIFVLCAAATIDEDLYDVVVEKGLNAKQVLETLKKGAR